jgi:hypothetical protein
MSEVTGFWVAWHSGQELIRTHDVYVAQDLPDLRSTTIMSLHLATYYRLLWTCAAA